MWIFHLWGTLIHLGDAISCTKPYICIYPIYEEHQSELKKTAWYTECLRRDWDNHHYFRRNRLHNDFETRFSIPEDEAAWEKQILFITIEISFCHFGRMINHDVYGLFKYIRTLLVKTWYEGAPLKIWITFFDGNIFSKKLMRWVNKLYCPVCGFVTW